MKFRYIIFAAMAAASLTSCNRNDVLPSDGSRPVMLNLSVDGIVPGDTKSASYTDGGVYNLYFYLYDDKGNYVRSFNTGGDTYYPRPSELARDGRTYTIYAYANMQDIISKTTMAQKDPDNQIFTLSYKSSGYMPMVGKKTVTINNSTDIITIPVTRLFAKLDFKVDRSKLPSGVTYTVTGASLHQVNNTMRAITPGYAASAAWMVNTDGDQFTSTDISRLNSGQSASLYMPENCVGKISAITDPWNKVPDRISSKVAPYATYIEVDGEWSDASRGISKNGIKYRFYLGSNNTSDFNVQRNKAYHVTLIPSADPSSLPASWKVEMSSFAASLTINYNSAEDINYGDTETEIWY